MPLILFLLMLLLPCKTVRWREAAVADGVRVNPLRLEANVFGCGAGPHTPHFDYFA